jgi:amino-acid N-acetyltransferase
MRFRKPIVSDAVELTHLINRDDSILPRSLHYVFQNLRDFTLIEEEGRIIGCGSLHILWEDIAEVRSVTFADAESAQNGLFHQLIDAFLDEGRKLGVRQVFALTYDPERYVKLGFRLTDRAQVQRLVWNECINCVHFPDCAEKPVIFDLDAQQTDPGGTS